MSQEESKIKNEDLLKNTISGFLEGKAFDRFSNKFGEEKLEYSTNTEEINKSNQYSNSSDLALDVVIAMKNELFKQDKENKELFNKDFQHYQTLHAKKGSEGQYQFFLEKDKEDNNALKEQKANKFKDKDFETGDIIFFKTGAKGKQWGGEAVVLEDEGKKFIVTITKEGFNKIELSEWLEQQKEQTIARGRFNFNQLENEPTDKKNVEKENIKEEELKEEKTVKSQKQEKLKVESNETSSPENKVKEIKNNNEQKDINKHKNSHKKSTVEKTDEIKIKESDILKTEIKHGVKVVQMKNGDVEVIGGPIKAKAVYQGRVVSDDFIAKMEKEQSTVKKTTNTHEKHTANAEKHSVEKVKVSSHETNEPKGIKDKVESVIDKVMLKMEGKPDPVKIEGDEVVQSIKQNLGLATSPK